MSEKMLFFLIYFIGVGMIIGSFISPVLLILGVIVVVTNAMMMGVLCNIIFK